MKRNLIYIFVLSIFILGLSACGGGGGGGDTTPPPPTNNVNWDQMKWDQDNWS